MLQQPGLHYGGKTYNFEAAYYSSYMRIKQIIYLAAAANLFVTSSCHNEKTRIDRLWFFTDSRSGSSAPDTTLSPASFLNIQSNGFYTCDFDRFYYGKWKFEGNKLFLMDNSGMVSSLDVPMLAGNDLQLQRNTESVDYFESHPHHLLMIPRIHFRKKIICGASSPRKKRPTAS